MTLTALRRYPAVFGISPGSTSVHANLRAPPEANNVPFAEPRVGDDDLSSCFPGAPFVRPLRQYSRKLRDKICTKLAPGSKYKLPVATASIISHNLTRSQLFSTLGSSGYMAKGNLMLYTKHYMTNINKGRLASIKKTVKTRSSHETAIWEDVNAFISKLQANVFHRTTEVPCSPNKKCDLCSQ
ncbi:hypothetical protein H257_14795 [Aphanomyces astaci]|uniref:Uncharacterized protein n=1 Tax=Aphanomyces astaci TaxID=112090 RepID=W4FRX6_APHAT|nr:hypothetical protein H257_14795 [Aphanomyces astaci]ETV69559.1 hypothetical protein H257_14795 [Aphanomyces astaci]|eukprot:XP_009840983.1 hypothetical protein H257_14795 [Aphanomyces astaci]